MPTSGTFVYMYGLLGAFYQYTRERDPIVTDNERWQTGPRMEF